MKIVIGLIGTVPDSVGEKETRRALNVYLEARFSFLNLKTISSCKCDIIHLIWTFIHNTAKPALKSKRIARWCEIVG